MKIITLADIPRCMGKAFHCARAGNQKPEHIPKLYFYLLFFLFFIYGNGIYATTHVPSNCRKRWNWRSCAESRKAGKRNPGPQLMQKWRCCLASLTSKSCQEYWEWKGSPRSSCFGVKGRWTSSSYWMESSSETLLLPFSLVNICKETWTNQDFSGGKLQKDRLHL